ncbi:DUF1996 domain-containing protein [Sphaerisporangium sp. TRM90804]|uniref:DUF1996 domain-containing protein n=1 Tax=Sphaerisporangium sp. TRM90804 TaxID=3031113 RepID=UPI00244A93A9|nr:DUF1996 domain-containing protein [Sphaerisporangium sp. TRM90804]MDH2427156.1 DUF1996 domain-containing protein [Sphaerisporangium sp. TRM90804]
MQHRRRFRPVLSALALSGAGISLVVGSLTPAAQPMSAEASLSALTVGAAAPTVDCPSVADALPQIPAAVAAEVEQKLAFLDDQVAAANRQLTQAGAQADRDFIQDSVLSPLREKRLSTLNRIIGAIDRVAARPTGLQELADCSVSTGAAGGAQNPAPSPSAPAEDPTAAPEPTESEQATPSPTADAGDGDGEAAVRTVNCPSVSEKLPEVPARAEREVQRNLDLLDRQIAQANQRLARLGDRGSASVIRATVLNPLRVARTITINRISNALLRAGVRAVALRTLRGLQTCQLQDGAGGGEPTPTPSPTGSDDPTASPSPTGTGDPTASPTGSPSPSPSPTGSGGANGPSPEDFVDIRSVQPNVNRPNFSRAGSRGSFVSRCGRNEGGHHNSDNVIVAPGVTNGAHHVHDYVGNLDSNGFSTNESLLAADTTCSNGDKSTHYWPVVRLQNRAGPDADKPGGGLDGNVGQIVKPASVTLTMRGNPNSKVVAMPQFLRIITGDAKSFTNGPTNANARWTCTGFENRTLKDKYPICPRGSQVVRLLQFQSCWDGSNIDSANHRTHVTFAGADGACPEGFQAIPALEQRITYNLPPGPGFALDSFPEQLHKPVTDHGDFINVMSEDLMKRAVDCINTGRRC